MPKRYTTIRTNDLNIAKKIISISETFSADESKLNATLEDQGVGNATLPSQQFEISNKLLDNPFFSETISVANYSVSFKKGGTAFSLHIKRDAGADEVTISFNSTNPSDCVAFTHLVQSHFPTFDQHEAIDKILGTELSEFYRQREQSLMRLEELSQKVIEQNEEYRRRTDAELNENRKKLQEDFDARRDELQKDTEAKIEAVRKREDTLEERIKDLDDRSNKHARRQIQKDIKKLTGQRSNEFKLTKGTVSKRNIIHATFILVMSAMIASIMQSFIVLKSSPDPQNTLELYYPIKIAFSTLALIAMGLYYIRWNDNWFKRHADEEFNIKRFELDIDRASWVVEMALEWQKDTQGELPKGLLDKLTTNLFEPIERAGSAKHPYEDIIPAILGASSELDINLPMANVRVDRKGTNQLKKRMEKG